LLAGAVLAGGLGDAAHREEDVVVAEIGAQCPVPSPSLQQSADGVGQEGVSGSAARDKHPDVAVR
jgi:hypothetical protein